MKLKEYINTRFSNIDEVDYVDVFINDEMVGMFTASLAARGTYLSLDPMDNDNNVSYCFPLETIIDNHGGAGGPIKFHYCGSDFELTMFRSCAKLN